MKKKNVISISIFLIGLFLICVIFSSLFKYNTAKSEYDEYTKEFNIIAQQLITDKTNLNELQDELSKYEDNLYIAMNNYYESSDNEVLRYVFQHRYPTIDEYQKDKRQTFVIIYALLELYPEMKVDADISINLYGIKVTNETLFQYSNNYNNKVDDYNELADKINDSDYVNYWNPDANITTTVNKVNYEISSYYSFSELKDEAPDPETVKLK